jgi:peptidoglycan/xylan/chitin deacetylase (PgdA/CDA1 family)
MGINKNNLILLLLGIIFVFFIFRGLTIKGSKNLIASIFVTPTPTATPTPTLTPTPSSTPTPTSTPTPSPTPTPSGFCLHVPVVLYHHIKPLADAAAAGQKSLDVDPSYFDGQMKYLSEQGYTSLKAEDLVNALINHTGVPAKPIIITFDDGYDDINQYAYPIARKYNMTINLMIITGLMDNPGYLSWNQLKEMVNSGTVRAYDHTWSHYPLVNGDEGKITMEINTAQQQLDDHLGTTPKVITYPNGSVDGRVISIAKNNGFIAGFSTVGGSTQCDSFIMTLHRFRIGNSTMAYYGF